jgi:hypothetical protein
MRFLFSALFVFAASLSAHECWLQPSTFSPAPGAPVSLGIRVGMDFTGEGRPMTRQRVARLLHGSATGREDWTERVPAKETGVPDLTLRLDTPGTHVLAYDSAPNLITLEADKFHDYLREDGMDYVIALREKAGSAGAPGRERYRRCAKTIIQCGPAADPGFGFRTGQMIEIVPLANLAAVRPGSTLRFLVLFQQQPLPGSLVQAWHRADGRTSQLRAHTNAQGEAEFTLPAAGEWMISTVRMVAAADHTEADWESYWGNLTFSLDK